MGPDTSLRTTHLIAARLGTAKVNEARRLKSSGIKVVTPDWLWCCAERWEHIDERLLPLEKMTPVTLRPPAHCSSPEIAFAERCSEINIQRQNSGDSLPESNNPFLAMSSADLKDMEDEIDASSDSSSTDSDEDQQEKKRKLEEERSSSEESLSVEAPKGWATSERKRSKVTDSRNASDGSEDDQDDDDSDYGAMAEQLEGFLGDDADNDEESNDRPEECI